MPLCIYYSFIHSSSLNTKCLLLHYCNQSERFMVFMVQACTDMVCFTALHCDGLC